MAWHHNDFLWIKFLERFFAAQAIEAKFSMDVYSALTNLAQMYDVHIMMNTAPQKITRERQTLTKQIIGFCIS